MGNRNIDTIKVWRNEWYYSTVMPTWFQNFMVAYSDTLITTESAFDALSWDYYVGSSSKYGTISRSTTLTANNQIYEWTKINAATGNETTVSDFPDLTSSGTTPTTNPDQVDHYKIQVPNTNNRRYMYFIFTNYLTGSYVQIPEMKLFSLENNEIVNSSFISSSTIQPTMRQVSTPYTIATDTTVVKHYVALFEVDAVAGKSDVELLTIVQSVATVSGTSGAVVSDEQMSVGTHDKTVNMSFAINASDGATAVNDGTGYVVKVFTMNDGWEAGGIGVDNSVLWGESDLKISSKAIFSFDMTRENSYELDGSDVVTKLINLAPSGSSQDGTVSSATPSWGIKRIDTHSLYGRSFYSNIYTTIPLPTGFTTNSKTNDTFIVFYFNGQTYGNNLLISDPLTGKSGNFHVYTNAQLPYSSTTSIMGTTSHLVIYNYYYNNGDQTVYMQARQIFDDGTIVDHTGSETLTGAVRTVTQNIAHLFYPSTGMSRWEGSIYEYSYLEDLTTEERSTIYNDIITKYSNQSPYYIGTTTLSPSINVLTREMTYIPQEFEWISVKVISIDSGDDTRSTELALYSTTYTTELQTSTSLPVERDTSENITVRSGTYPTYTYTNANMIHNGNLGTNSLQQINALTEATTLPFSYEYKLSTPVSGFVQLLIGSTTDHSGFPHILEIYGGNTYDEAKNQTNLMQTIDISYKVYPKPATSGTPDSLYNHVFNLNESTGNWEDDTTYSGKY